MSENFKWISSCGKVVEGTQTEEFTEIDRICYGTPEKKAEAEAEAKREREAAVRYFTDILGARYNSLPEWSREALIQAVTEDLERLALVKAATREANE
ncbi:hypothetical protein [Gracilibacillus thailandensis]|uniref:Uncharacterized protein n=1 Tax=Gracilibacillus thailandensis TaxID=563735 RepID=A0A6N7QWS9_9BACI|nr:hypothetical protein [Gracilibacillus thailandensis]MRI65345.1 hypothetical protein [Gracilibacillus thailandensis]